MSGTPRPGGELCHSGTSDMSDDDDPCDRGDHYWSDPDECPVTCGDDRCMVVCDECGLIDLACED